MWYKGTTLLKLGAQSSERDDTIFQLKFYLIYYPSALMKLKNVRTINQTQF